MYEEPQPAASVVADGGDRQAQRARLLPVDVELILRLIVQSVGPQHADGRVLRRKLKQLAARLHQRLRARPRPDR